jgi:hypothetical protein
MKEYTFHALALEYRRMSEHDLGRMEEAMRAHGFDKRFPIILFDGQILDGCNRYIAAQRAEVKPLFETFKGTPEEAANFVRLANEERRHLTEGELSEKRKARIERVAAARQSGESLRTIAGEEGVSVAQVQSDLEKASTVHPPCTVEPEGGTVKGKDGRTRTANPKILCDRCKRIGATKDCAACKEARKKPKKVKGETEVKGDADEGEIEKIEDAEGVPVPPECVPAFQAARDITKICREIDDIIHRADAIAKGPGGRLIRFEDFKQNIKDAKGNLWANRATHVCPYCHAKHRAKPCEACKGDGWVAKHIYEQAPGVREAKK